MGNDRGFSFGSRVCLYVGECGVEVRGPIGASVGLGDCMQVVRLGSKLLPPEPSHRPFVLGQGLTWSRLAWNLLRSQRWPWALDPLASAGTTAATYSPPPPPFLKQRKSFRLRAFARIQDLDRTK